MKILSRIPNVVHEEQSHTSPTKGMTALKKQPEVIIRCIGDKKEPSKEAVDRFISIYIEIVKENQKRRR